MAQKHRKSNKKRFQSRIYVYLNKVKLNLDPVGAMWVPVKGKYVVKLDILMSCYQTHGEVVQSLHQFDYGIVVLGKEGVELQCIINNAHI